MSDSRVIYMAITARDHVQFWTRDPDRADRFTEESGVPCVAYAPIPGAGYMAADPLVVDVLAEERRARHKFPTWPSDPLHASGVVMEEAGELAKAVLQAVYEPHKSGPVDVREEAVQLAAMALRFLRSMDAYRWLEADQHVQGGPNEQ